MGVAGAPTGRWGLNRIVVLAVVGLVVGMLGTGCGGAPMPPLPDHNTADEPVLPVAVLVPLRGELATFGEEVRNGVGLALDEWNARGGVGGWRLRPVWMDTPCEAAAAEGVARQATADGIQFMVGGMCSEAAVPIARVAEESGSLFIATGATHPSVTVTADGTTRAYVFAVALPYPYQGRAAAHFVVESLDITRTAVFANADPFARDILAAYEPALMALGGHIVSTASIGGTDADLTPAVAAAVAADARAFYVPGSAAMVAQVSRAARSTGLDVPVVGSDWWSQQDIALPELNGVYLISHFTLDETNGQVTDWAQRFRSAYSVEPDALAALGYDAASLLAAGMRGSTSVTPDSVAHTIAASPYSGVTGPWRFDARHYPLKSAVVVQVSDGRLHPVAAASVQ
jgi:branched-chain amino acid transport system substrate-binding protein